MSQATINGVVVPILCVWQTVFISFNVWIVRKISSHDVALALILQVLNPPGEKSLREMVQNIAIENARQTGAAEANKGYS